jgi:hypothetical protein
MFNAIGSLNWIAIILATAVYFILGGLWFAPFLFGRLWHKAIGFEKPKDWKPSARYYLGPLIGALIITIATAMLLKTFSIHTYFDAISLGFIVGAGYAGSVSFINAITPKTPQPFVQGFIVGVYHTLSIILVSIILVALH